MKKRYKIALSFLGLLVAGGAFGIWYFSTADSREPSLALYNANCSSCHGASLEGSDFAPALLGGGFKNGDGLAQLIYAISSKSADTVKYPWANKLSDEEIKSLALLISERRQGFPTTSVSYEMIPTEDRLISSKYHDFVLEHVAVLRSRPYSLAPLPIGETLISEKIGGLSIVDAQGKQSQRLAATPQIRDFAIGLDGPWFTLGSLLDVELHPEFDANGWIYLSHAHRCDWSCGWVVPGTMVRVVRGRIDQGEWVDQQVIWDVDTDHYTPVPDAVAGGRLAFDGQGYLYVTVGGKNTYDKLHDLNTPFGKIHRVYDDGRIPTDNPFWRTEEERPDGSTAHTVWSFGHRTGQGLDGHPATGEIWNSEMGPRGGDEINLIEPSQNYGWPLYTNGQDYNGEQVSIGKELGLDFAIEDTVLPIVDFTPAPAVSNFTFHQGENFPDWEDDILLGTLKEGALYRIRIDGDREIEREKLITAFGRIRDVAMGFDGFVYIVIEHEDNGSLWRLKPVSNIGKQVEGG